MTPPAPPHVSPSRLRRHERRAADRAPVLSLPVADLPLPVADAEEKLRLALVTAFARVMPSPSAADRSDAGRDEFSRLAYSRTAVAAGPTSLPANDAARVRREVLGELVERALQ